MIPVIETERLRLRGSVKADFDAAANFLASERARFLGGPYDTRAAWRGFAATVGSWLIDGYGYWEIEPREGGPVIGACGFIGPPDLPERELGWMLYDGHEGQGYATEAAAAARRWAYEAAGFETLVSYVDPENDRSIRVAERLGCTADGSAPRLSPETIVFRHPSPEALR